LWRLGFIIFFREVGEVGSVLEACALGAGLSLSLLALAVLSIIGDIDTYVRTTDCCIKS
jgi:hypothetical protein